MLKIGKLLEKFRKEKHNGKVKSYITPMNVELPADETMINMIKKGQVKIGESLLDIKEVIFSYGTLIVIPIENYVVPLIPDSSFEESNDVVGFECTECGTFVRCESGSAANSVKMCDTCIITRLEKDTI